MSSQGGFPPLRPPPAPHSPSGHRSQSSLSQTSQRSESSMSTTSNDSAAVPLSVNNSRSPYMQQGMIRSSTAVGPAASQSTSALHGIHSQQVRTSVDGSYRPNSPGMPQSSPFAHRARQRSQGFFEPSLPHAAMNVNGLSASQIAAQTAMHHISPPPQQERKRSFPGLTPINTNGAMGSRQGSSTQSPQVSSAGALSYSNGTLGGNRLAATTAANVAFPRGKSPLPSPQPQAQGQFPIPNPPLEKEPKTKSSKMKLFSKAPKAINLSKEKESREGPTVPSPAKSVYGAQLLRGGFTNASTTSLTGPESSASSLYSSANASTSTLVPFTMDKEKEKEKRHHFLSRQKHKLKDDVAQMPLSSAHSNSQPTNPEKPAPLYSFTPDSPGPNTFAKSMSGFDLRHGGRALRGKKKEEKAAAAAAKLELTPTISNSSNLCQTDQYLGPSQYDSSIGPPSATGASLFSLPSETGSTITQQTFSTIGAQMGLPGIGPDDAWPLLKARLLNLFSGEDLRTPVEDFNALVTVHIRRCIQRKTAIVLIEDVRDLLQTGFTSLRQTLRGVSDDRLITKLVEIWISVYGNILPFLEAVFLPLDLEFKGRGVIMSVREAQEFWGAMPESLKSDEGPSSAGDPVRPPTLGEELDVRRLTLISFRDIVILPRHENLMAVFSRLSLGSLNSTTPEIDKGREYVRNDPMASGMDRPGTANSLDPHLSSFNSQTSTLLDAASSSSGGALSLASRSRATSNTSAGSFGASLPHVNLNSPAIGAPGSFSATAGPPSPPESFIDPTKVTETVARMLQCLYVLASCQTGDTGQGVVERLTGALKYNWLGRGRTGRDRRGWVGMKNSPGQRVGIVTA
nr:target of rapamycin complex 2 subunit bit61 [Quercus suber]